MPRRVPGLVIAGAASGVGKTTVAIGLMRAFSRRGLRVQPFKVGPDYIDPSYHHLACGGRSRNLDTWMVSPEVVRELYVRANDSADLALVEGVMGLFDGRSGRDEAGSAAEVARLLGLPVLLVLDVGKMARSAAAMALGYQRFDPRVKVAGVIANNVGSVGHFEIVRDAIESANGLPVVGYLPRRDDLQLPERHLGLIPAAEGTVGVDFVERVAQQVEETVDLEAVRRLAELAESVAVAPSGLFPESLMSPRTAIAVAQDEAFCFYYQDNLDLLEAWGASVVPFSPLRDERLPDGVQGAYLGGGFPELFATRLAGNRSMLASIRVAQADGMPIYAECGGLMYLCAGLTDLGGRRHSMVGIVPAEVTMPGQPLTLGYVEVRARRDTCVLRQGQTARGHEFHRSGLKQLVDEAGAPYQMVEDGRLEGYQRGDLLASYIHLHFASEPSIARNLVEACVRCGATR